LRQWPCYNYEWCGSIKDAHRPHSISEVLPMPSTSTAAKLEIGGLGKQKMMALAAKAKRLGLSPASYVKQLVEEDLAIESDAQSMTLAQIMAPVRKEFRDSAMTEQELDTIVTAARSRHRPSSSGKKR
jgi:hypothetical protein